MLKAAVCLVTLAGLASATELQYAITPNRASIGSHTAYPTNFTYTLTQTDINAFTNFWFIATIPPGQFGNGTSNENARMSIRTVAPSNTAWTKQYPNATAEDNGWLTNGQVVVTLDPRYNKLFVNAQTNLKFRVKASGDFAASAFVPYNASLYAKAPTTTPSEADGNFGHVGMWDGTTYTASVPCCGARWQIPVAPNAHIGYFLAANVTATNNTLLSASLWEFGVNGVQNQRMFDPAPSATEMQPSLAVKTCDGFDDCTTYIQTYWLEVQTPFDSPYAATFQYTFSLFPAANNPSTTGSNSNGTASSSTGLNAASAHAPSNVIAAFTVLFAALLALFTR